MPESAILQEYFKAQNGKLLCIADDLTFVRTVRHALSGASIKYDDVGQTYQDQEQAFQAIKKLNNKKRPCIVLIERSVGGISTTDFILRVSRLFNNVCLFVVGANLTKEIIAYLYEIGAKGIIGLPASAEGILGKVLTCVDMSKEQYLTTYVKDLIADANSQEALNAIDKYLVQNPGSCAAYCLKGDALLADGDYARAIEVYKQAQSMNLLYTMPIKRMVALYKHTQDDKALELLNKLERISPFNPDRKLEMAEIHLRKGNQNEASALLDTGFKQAAKEFSTMLGDIAERIVEIAGETLPEVAEKYLNQAIESKRSFTQLDIPMFNKLGLLLRSRGEWEEAITVYRKALKAAPDDATLHYNIALAYFDGKRKIKALQALDNALQSNSEFYKLNENVAYNVGSIYFGCDEKEKAFELFQHVLELNPDNEKAKSKMEASKPDPKAES